MTVLILFSLCVGGSHAFFIAGHGTGGNKKSSVEAGATGELASRETEAKTSGFDESAYQPAAAQAVTTEESKAKAPGDLKLQVKVSHPGDALTPPKTVTTKVLVKKGEALAGEPAVSAHVAVNPAGASGDPPGKTEVKAHVIVDPQNVASPSGDPARGTQVKAHVIVNPQEEASPGGDPATQVRAHVTVNPQKEASSGGDPAGGTQVKAHVTVSPQASPSGDPTHVAAHVTVTPNTAGTGADRIASPPLARRWGVSQEKRAEDGAAWAIEGMVFFQEGATDAGGASAGSGLQNLGFGVASYHFKQGGSYISYRNAPAAWHLDDAETRPMPPWKKEWTGATYDGASNTFRGDILWNEYTFNGDAKWVYEIHFADDFQTIDDGSVQCFGPGGEPTKKITYNPAHEPGFELHYYRDTSGTNWEVDSDEFTQGQARAGTLALVQFGNHSLVKGATLMGDIVKAR